jgi:hypothetical protein
MLTKRNMDQGLRMILTELSHTLLNNKRFLYELRNKLSPSVPEYHNNDLHIIDTLDRFFKHGNMDKLYYSLFRVKVCLYM